MANTKNTAPTNWNKEITTATLAKFEELGGERENLAELREWVNTTYEWNKSEVAIRTKLSTEGVWKAKENTSTASKSTARPKATLVKALGAVTGLPVDTAVKMTKAELEGLLEWAESKAEKPEDSES